MSRGMDIPVEEDDALCAMMDSVEERLQPNPASPVQAPVLSLLATAPTTYAPNQAAPTAMSPSHTRSSKWVPHKDSKPYIAPFIAPVPILISDSPESPPRIELPALTRQEIGNSGTLDIELSYGGNCRIRVTISASDRVSTKSKSSFSTSSKYPIISNTNLPRFLRDAFEIVKKRCFSSKWDGPVAEPSPWPAYEEKLLDLADKKGVVTAHWLFPLSVSQQLETALQDAVDQEGSRQNSNFANKVTIKLTLLPPFVKSLMFATKDIYLAGDKILHGPTTALEGSELTSILPADLLQQDVFKCLKEYQLRGVEYAYSRKGRILLADEPGLGKTIQAIAIACCYKPDWPVLVICPSSVRPMWAREWERWGPPDATISLNLTGAKTQLNADVNIISYELLKSQKILDDIVKQAKASSKCAGAESPFGVVICDEAHYLKGYNTVRTNAIVPLVRKAQRVVMLSGTPMPNRTSEIFNLLDCLHHRSYQWFPFANRYCDPVQTRFGRDFKTEYKGASHSAELNCFLTEALMIRRLKANVLGDLPAKKRHQLLLTIPPEARDQLANISREMRELSEQLRGANGSASTKSKKAGNSPFAELSDPVSIRSRQYQVTLELFQNAGRAKIKVATAHLLASLDQKPDEKFLVFAHHKDILDAFASQVRDKGVQYIRIDGATASVDRQKLVDNFQENPECRVALLSIMAAGVGITLTRASTVFFAELFWNPSSLLQAEDRAHRIGQDRDVEVYYMIAKDTYDERLWEAVDDKLSRLSALLDNKKGRMSLDSISHAAPDAASDASEDSFLQHIFQKISGYEARAEMSRARLVVRRKAREGTLDDYFATKHDSADETDETDDMMVDNEHESLTTHSITSYSSHHEKQFAKKSQSVPSKKRKTDEKTAHAPTSDPSRSALLPTVIPYAPPVPSSGTVFVDLEEDWNDDMLYEPAFKKSTPLPVNVPSSAINLEETITLPQTTAPIANGVPPQPYVIPEKVQKSRADLFASFAAT